MTFQTVRFNRAIAPDFAQTLKQRVNDYFESNNISRYATPGMVVKTIFMLALFFVPYALIITNTFSSVWAVFAMWALMGFGTAGIGLSIMHDANHGAYSRHSWINDMLGYTLNLVGGSAIIWRIQHNVLHHSYTNIDGMDEDIHPGDLMRFSPHQPLYKHHRYQHIYAWFLYSLMTLLWITAKEFRQVKRYHEKGLIEPQGRTRNGLLIELVAFKVFYYAAFLILPLLISNVAWWQTLIFFLVSHFISGLVLAMIFQPAHVMSECEYPMPNEKGNIENNFAIHQLQTTSNFAPNNKLLSWYAGGLNYQVEHHLLSNVCHVHYSKLSPIVKATAEEFGLPYHSQPTFRKALLEHGKMLWKLGRD